jgi:hypothetical protein
MSAPPDLRVNFFLKFDADPLLHAHLAQFGTDRVEQLRALAHDGLVMRRLLLSGSPLLATASSHTSTREDVVATLPGPRTSTNDLLVAAGAMFAEPLDVAEEP